MKDKLSSPTIWKLFMHGVNSENYLVLVGGPIFMSTSFKMRIPTTNVSYTDANCWLLKPYLVIRIVQIANAMCSIE